MSHRLLHCHVQHLTRVRARAWGAGAGAGRAVWVVLQFRESPPGGAGTVRLPPPPPRAAWAGGRSSPQAPTPLTAPSTAASSPLRCPLVVTPPQISESLPCCCPLAPRPPAPGGREALRKQPLPPRSWQGLLHIHQIKLTACESVFHTWSKGLDTFNFENLSGVDLNLHVPKASGLLCSRSHVFGGGGGRGSGGSWRSAEPDPGRGCGFRGKQRRGSSRPSSTRRARGWLVGPRATRSGRGPTDGGIALPPRKAPFPRAPVFAGLSLQGLAGVSVPVPLPAAQTRASLATRQHPGSWISAWLPCPTHSRG